VAAGVPPAGPVTLVLLRHEAAEGSQNRQPEILSLHSEAVKEVIPVPELRIN
jgi:hypothetical protein